MRATPADDAYSRGVYFCSDSGQFSYAAFCLADGLSQLGVPVYANIDASHALATVSFSAAPEPALLSASYCAVLDVHGACDLFPNTVRRITPIHERTVALCMHDNIANFIIEGQLPLFCSHENRFFQLSGVRIPIGFGVSQKLLERSSWVPPFNARGAYALKSFHPSLHQDVRAGMELLFEPNLQQQLRIEHRYTDSREAFWTLLQQSGFSLCYGGMFVQDLHRSPFFMSIEAVREFWEHIECRATTVITRWDSWRFWESLASGCVTIHLDFERYGFKLPVMPENWRQYIGIDMANAKQDVERMMDEWGRMEEVAWNGRQWALEHYSPVAVARRFLVPVRRLDGRAEV